MLLNRGESVYLPVVGKPLVIRRDQAQRFGTTQGFQGFEAEMAVEENVGGNPVAEDWLGMNSQRLDYTQLPDGRENA
ncbi:hypothetical protein D9M69_577270 [compost metagenome]